MEDGIDVPISFSLAQNQTDPGLLFLVLEIPHFNSSSFQYDPDFTVILPSQQQEETSSSATNLLPLLSLIVLILVTLVAIIVLVALLVWACRWHILWTIRKSLTGNVTIVDRDGNNVL